MPTRMIIMQHLHAEDTSNFLSHSPDLQKLPNSEFHCEKMNFHILAYRTLEYPVSFRSVSFRFVAQNTISRIFRIRAVSRIQKLIFKWYVRFTLGYNDYVERRMVNGIELKLPLGNVFQHA